MKKGPVFPVQECLFVEYVFVSAFPVYDKNTQDFNGALVDSC